MKKIVFYKKLYYSIFLVMVIGGPAMMQMFIGGYNMNPPRGIQFNPNIDDKNLESSFLFPQTLRVGISSGPDTLEPVDSWEGDRASNDVLEQVVETLFARNLTDVELPRINRLAQSYWWKDLNTLQIELRQGIFFHDSTPFNPAAAKWNLDRLLYLTNCSGTNMGPVAHTQPLWMFPDGVTPIIYSVVMVGDWNITITLNDPYAPLLDLLCYINAGMISPMAHQNRATSFLTIWDVPVGTGPFKYVSYSPGISVNFIRWDSYWRDPAYFEEMIYLIFDDAMIAHNAFLNYEIDINLLVSEQNMAQYETDRNFTVFRFTDITGKPSLVYQYLGFNNHKYNATWRKAFSYAFNYSYVIEELQLGNVVRAYSAISPGFGAAYNDSIPAIAIPNNGNLTLARQTMVSMGLGDMGWTDQQWIDVAEGPSPFLTASYQYNVGSSYREDLGTAVESWLKLIGVATILEELYIVEFLDRLNKEFDLLGIFAIGWPLGWKPDYLDAYNMLNPLFNPASSHNNAQVNDPTLNAMMAAVLAVTDDNARNEIYKNIQGYMAEFGYFHAPLYHSKISYSHLTRIRGVPYNAMEAFYAYPIYSITPASFSLTSNAANPDDDGIFDLTWTLSDLAENYTIYQYSSYITNINGSLTELATEITNLSLALSGYLDGTYYFIVMAHNEYGDTLSNCISITVWIPKDHDLSVFLEVPNSIEIGISYTINATVKNQGLNDETNVQFFLSLDEVLIGSLTVPNLPVGTNETIQFLWIPTDYGDYNFTAYALPVAGETYIENNKITINVNVEITKTLTIINPHISSSWQPGLAYYINWSSTGAIISVRIELYRNETLVMEIVSNTINDGEYYWLVSSGLVDSTNYRIRIIDMSNPFIFGYSDYFEIKTPSSAPPGGIPGYDLFILVGVLSLIGVYIARKKVVTKL